MEGVWPLPSPGLQPGEGAGRVTELGLSCGPPGNSDRRSGREVGTEVWVPSRDRSGWLGPSPMTGLHKAVLLIGEQPSERDRACRTCDVPTHGVEAGGKVTTLRARPVVPTWSVDTPNSASKSSVILTKLGVEAELEVSPACVSERTGVPMVEAQGHG